MRDLTIQPPETADRCAPNTEHNQPCCEAAIRRRIPFECRRRFFRLLAFLKGVVYSTSVSLLAGAFWKLSGFPELDPGIFVIDGW